MGFFDDRANDFWLWFTRDLSVGQRSALIVILVAGVAAVLVLGGRFNEWQVLMMSATLIVVVWYVFWLRYGKVSLIILVGLLLACSVITALFLTATQRRARGLIADAQELKKQGEYQRSLSVLADARKLLEKLPQSTEAALSCLEMGETETCLGQWEQAERTLNECKVLPNDNRSQEGSRRRTLS